MEWNTCLLKKPVPYVTQWPFHQSTREFVRNQLAIVLSFDGGIKQCLWHYPPTADIRSIGPAKRALFSRFVWFNQ
jgi:hypothetical protein